MAMFIAAIVFDYHMLLCGELENQDELFIAIAYRDTRAHRLRSSRQNRSRALAALLVHTGPKGGGLKGLQIRAVHLAAKSTIPPGHTVALR